MPELPEVQTVVDTLAPLLVGRPIRTVLHLRDDIVNPPGFDLIESLTGRVVTGIARRGKKIVITLNDENRFFIHLGMTGRLTTCLAADAIEPHTHFIADVGDHHLRFRDPRRFGGIFWLARDEAPDSELGPEPLNITPKQLHARLQKTRRAIKTALLDQSLIAGLGNIYADEALFAARLNPTCPANELTPPQVARLTRAIKSTLNRALHHRGSTLRDYRDANGESGNFQKLHRVYDRAGQPCRTCRTPIVRIVLGGRSTHYCPKCQK
jgi:formamidopyrimidine-DNA glycosylase